MSRNLVVSTLFFLWPALLHAQQFEEVSSEVGIYHIYQSPNYSGGMSFIDFDLDGWDDLSFTSSNVNPRFYRNAGGTFVQQPVNFTNSQDMKMLTWVDFDNDGDRDLFYVSFFGPLKLMRNNGAFSFTDISTAAGFGATTAMGSSCAWGDYDRDGDLDVYVCNYDGTQLGTNGITNWLFRNNGNETFTEVGIAAGVDNGSRYTYQANWTDYNGDLWPDLLVVNDRTSEQNYLYRNNANGTFTNVSANSQIGGYPIFSMSATSDDYDNDGDSDFYITNGLDGNLLHRNNNNGTFTEVAAEAGVLMNAYCWGANFVDTDLDGWQDLYVASSPAFGSAGLNALYQNNADGTFTNQIFEAGMGTDLGHTFSTTIGDLDRNGLPDIVTMGGIPTPTRVWRNNTSESNWITTTLRGVVSNRDGVGALIQLYAGLVQNRYTHMGEAWCAQNSLTEFFGCGTAQRVDSIQVSWPSGIVDKWYNLPVNQHLTLVEGTGFRAEIAAPDGLLMCNGDSLLLHGGDHASWNWNSGEITSDLFVTTPGPYEILIATEGGLMCFADTVWVNFRPNVMIEWTAQNPLCAGGSNGFLTVDIISVVSDSIIEVSSNSELVNMSQLQEGEYSLAVSASDFCPVLEMFTLTSPDSLLAISEVEMPLCALDSGGVSIAISGGSPPYLIDWAGLDSSALASGFYEVMFTDAQECAGAVDFSVEAPLQLIGTLEVTPFFENGAGGTATLTIGGGTPPYSIVWSAIGEGSNTLSDLPAGAYEVEVIDANGCSIVFTFEIDFVAGIAEISGHSIQVHPNPSLYGELGFVAPLGLQWHCTVFSASGERIESREKCNSSSILRTSDWPAGVYILNLMLDNGSVVILRSIVMH